MAKKTYETCLYPEAKQVKKKTASRRSHVLRAILLSLTAAFVFLDLPTASAQERKQAVSTQIKFVCGTGPVASYDEFATVKVSIGNRPLSSPLTYDIPVGAQELKVTTQPPVGSWSIREIRFLDMSDLPRPGWQTFSPKLGTALFPLKLKSRYGTNVSQLEITVDQCGTAAPEHNIVKVRSPAKNYAWCENTFSYVSVERAPKGIPEDRVGGIQEEDNSFSSFFPLLMKLELPGRTKVIVPSNDTKFGEDWQVEVYVPGTAILTLDYDTVMTLPCRDPQIKEWVNAEIEASGGVIKYLSNVLSGQQHPDFIKITTKEAVSGVKVRTSYHHRSAASFAEPRFKVDMRTPGWSKFEVQEGQLEITPRNSALRPFLLRAGQSAEVSLNKVIGPETSSSGNPTTGFTVADLTGLWRNPGGSATYRFRQVGNKLHWLVDAVSTGSFANIFEGNISGASIEGSWTDLPGSPVLGGGKMSLKIESDCKIVKTNEVNHYGADVWVKKGSRCDVDAGRRAGIVAVQRSYRTGA